MTLRHTFGSGDFEFGPWATPFENANIEILEVAFAPSRPWPDGDKPHYRDQSLLRSPDDNDLTARVSVYESRSIYRVVFKRVSAFRLLDEGGLLQFWQKTKELGGRPVRTTFRVRNHLWAEESFASFLGTEDGWSFVIASDNECLEVLSAGPSIFLEGDPSASEPVADEGRSAGG